MIDQKKVIISLVLIFFIGAGSGYYYGKSFESSKIVEIKNQTNQANESATDTDLNLSKKIMALQKLDLLKSYTDMVLLPDGKITDLTKYVNEMGEKVKAINDTEITAKYYATGETTDKEQKIIDFLDFLNESVKADLQYGINK